MAIVVDACPQCGASVPPTAGTRISCAYCGSSLIRLGMPPVDGGPNDEADPLNQWGVRMRRAVCVDGKYGVPVFEWLIPADWGFRGQVWWRGSLTVPATVVFRAWNPEGSEQIECLPTISNIWTTSPMTSAMAKLGWTTRPFPLDGVEQRMPMGALDCLRELVVPRYRGHFPQLQGQRRDELISRAFGKDPNLQQWARQVTPYVERARDYLKSLKPGAYPSPNVEVHVVEEERLPGLAQSLHGREDNGATTSDGARMRIRYELDGQRYEEDLFCVASALTTYLGIGRRTQERTFWVAEALYAFRAAMGRLDTVGASCMASVKSFRMNPQFLEVCQMERQRIVAERRAFAQVMTQMAASQRRSFQGLGDLSADISSTSDMIMDGYATRSEAFDRMGQGMSEAIRGVDTWADPSLDHGVELPGGFDHAWTNGLGEYIVADDALFDPNIQGSQSWQHLQRQT